MKRSLTAFVLFLLFFSVSAHAIYVKAPSTIIIQQEQRDVPVTIQNDSYVGQDYSIRLLAPFNSVISPSSGYLGSGKGVIASLSITPSEEFEGSTYEATLEVEIGEEKAFRNVRVIFREEEESNGNESETTATGFFTLADFSGFWAGIFSPENVLNGFLGLIAAILLIAFIARFVKRLEAKK